MWEVTLLKKTGKNHLRNKLMCQDQVCYKDNDQCQVIVLADGIGDNDINTVCVKEVVEYSANELLNIMNSKIILSKKGKIIDQLMGGVINIISKYVDKGYSISDLGSTLLGMVVDHQKGRYLLVHLGDGIIIGNSRNGVRVFSYPVNGRENKTFLTTSDNLLKCMKVKIGEFKNLNRIILCSDGMYGLPLQREFWEKDIWEQCDGKAEIIDKDDDQSFIQLRRK